MGDEQADTGARILVGLMGDPGLPTLFAARLARGLPTLLGERLDDGVEWAVEVLDSSLPLDGDGMVELEAYATMVREQHGWDYLVYLTDLPKYLLNEPLVSTVDVSQGSAMIVLPALGLSGLRGVRRVLVQAVADLWAGTPSRQSYLSHLPPGASMVDALGGGDGEEGARARAEMVKGAFGCLAMLLGMVRSNQPMKLMPRLSLAIAAASATGAFGVFYASIWSMSDYLSSLRLAMTALLSVIIMTVWLAVSHGLFERPQGAHRRERWLLYNVATISTVFLAVVVMYALLFVLILLGALVVIDSGYLGAQLGHPASGGDYLDLAWLSASMGTIAGAVGSSMSDADVVRRATFSNREYERRQIAMETEKSDSA